MVKVVTSWVSTPLRGDGGAVLICTPANAHRILERLELEGLDVARLRANGRLKVLAAEVVMSRFMSDGVPDATMFRSLARDLMRSMRAACGQGEVRAWGEMVDILCKQGQVDAARDLEHIWNEAIETHGIRLLCSYEIDNLAPQTHDRMLRHVCEGHSVLIPEDDIEAFDRAVRHALVDVLGEKEAAAMRTTLPRERGVSITMPPAEAVLVGLHATRPDVAKRVFAATRAHLGA